MSVITARCGEYVMESWGLGSVCAHRVLFRGSQLRWSQVARAFIGAPDFRRALVRTLALSKLSSFFWECCPWPNDADPLFEFVLTDAPGFASRSADPSAFESHFAGADGFSVTFESLRKDRRLVAPVPRGRPDVFLHLGDFVRSGDPVQVDALLVALGEAIEARKKEAPGTLWVSTSGLGVPWLHLRLDSRPKYYTHREYCDEL